MLVKGTPIHRENIRNILIIQLGDIGDVVWSIPAFRAVKEFYAEAHLSLLVRGGTGRLLAGDPVIDRIFEVQGSVTTLFNRLHKDLLLIRALRRERFDFVLDLRLDDRGAYMARFTGAPIRVTQYNKNLPWRNRFFTHLVHPSSSEGSLRGAAEQSLRIIREFGIQPRDPVPRLVIAEATLHRASRLLAEADLDESMPWITLNPFSRWQYKEWGDEKWAEIIAWVWNRYGIATVIVGAAAERERAEYIAGRRDVAVCNLAGKTELNELAGILSLSRFHIGVDSAPPHIAAAVGTPTAIIYGPSSWIDWAPLGDDHVVIVPDCECAPCHRKGCDGEGWSRCLEEMGVDTVRDVLQRRIERFVVESERHCTGRPAET